MSKNINIIKKPIISEKSTSQAEMFRTYAFKVLPSANKRQVKEAIENLFKVDVVKVKTMVVHGKVKRAGRFVGKRTNWKKALVTIKDGQKIEFIQGA